MRNQAKIYIILFAIFIAILSGCVAERSVTTPAGKVTVDQGTTGPNWCKAGTKVTSTGPQGQGSFEIKGMTTYNGTEVCEAVIESDQGSTSYYFNEKYSYAVLVMKDKSGKIIQEVKMK